MHPDLSPLREEFSALAQGPDVNMARGNPSEAQLDLSDPMRLMLVNKMDQAEVRNYPGDIRGLWSARKMFGGFMNVDPRRVMVLEDESLCIMFDLFVHALLLGTADGPWRVGQKFLCPDPGYDRHNDIPCTFKFELIGIPITSRGPDMRIVRDLVREDPDIVGMWNIFPYDNPTGNTYALEVLQEQAEMRTANPAFRSFVDMAYFAHPLEDEEPPQIPDVLELFARAGNPNRVYATSSLSKVTFPGSAIAAVAMSEANEVEFLKFVTKRRITPNKRNQAEHVAFLTSVGIKEHMQRHREIMLPRFRAVDEELTKRLGHLGIAEWHMPRGGYFFSLFVPEGCAK